MAKCPECGAEIDTLRLIQHEVAKAYLYLSESGGVDTGGWDTIEVKETYFYCPECDELLFTNYDDAENFLAQKEEK